MNAAEKVAAPEAAWAERARRELADSILPFWWRAVDPVHGGVCNCFNNAGTKLVSRDKYTWSQGRFAWLWSRVGEAVAQGRLPGDAGRYFAQALRTVEFLQAHAFLEDGRCAFLLSEEGRLREAIPGAGPAPSIYADCFVAMGFAEFARVRGRRDLFDAAWGLAESIGARVAAGGFPTAPEPIPAGYESHAIAMITLNVTLVLHAAAAQLDDPRTAVARSRCLEAAERICGRFMAPDGRVRELLPSGPGREHTRLARHVNPGHALEGLWMLLTVARREGRPDLTGRAAAAVRVALERGWDERHGGILHYVDCDGGPPAGGEGDSAYERNVAETWDTKLWWVHSEALYATALAWRTTGDARLRGWFERVWEYTFRTFPQPDRSVGEWIQIRDRTGAPLERVVALPVKDPYHVARNLLQLIELFSEPPP